MYHICKQVLFTSILVLFSFKPEKKVRRKQFMTGGIRITEVETFPLGIGIIGNIIR
jgi:hypothetical protein